MLDSHVSSKSDARTVVTSAAYLLFYRRRSDADHPLGGPKLQEALRHSNDAAADSEIPRDSRDSSPVTGEGRRLGDSSHNGSSSALQVGHGHRVGAGPGGSADEESRQTRGLLAGTESPPRLMQGPAANSGGEDDPPPGYDDATMDNDSAVADVDTGANINANWTQEWSFNNLSQGRAPANSEDGMFGDRGSSNDSTRVEGGEASPNLAYGTDDEGSIHHIPDDEENALYSNDAGPIMHYEDFSHGRGLRESAPPPDEISAGIGMSGRGMSMPVAMNLEDDDMDDPPVAELQADPADHNELKFKPAA